MESLSNVYRWGEIYKTHKDKWNALYPDYINEDGKWNDICIRCNKNVSDERKKYDISCNKCKTNSVFYDIIKGYRYRECYDYNTNYAIECIYFHCHDCSISYNKFKELNRGKAYRLLKNKTEDKKCEITGCNKRQLKYHFESLFDNNMNWDNQSSHWQIDHRIPLAWFDLYNSEELNFACNFKNIQPMEKELNMTVKSCEYPTNNLFSHATHSSQTS